MVALPPPRLYLPAADREEDLMPERGPAQLLLLFFRPRARLGWKIGLAAASVALLGLLPGEESVYHQAKVGIAQSLRQAAWKRALANEPEARSWPWSEASPATYSKVPRLGLSAAVLHEKADKPIGPKPSETEQSSVILDGRDPHLNVGVAVGDRITVTKSDGTSQAYRVTGYELFDAQSRGEGDAIADGADPHYPRSESPLASVLRLIIEAVHVDTLERATSQEHKL
jgi:hypothetical protein